MKVSFWNVAKIAGAYTAYVIGSGFATGQEILQFFSVYGIYSFAAIAVSAVIFAWVGARVIADGYIYGEEKKGVYKFYCGSVVGSFYDIFVPIVLFGTVTVMISGAGAVFKEYYGVDYYVGCFVMALIVLISYLFGFRKLVGVLGIFGPLIIIFAVVVGGITVFRSMQSGNADVLFAAESINFFGIKAHAPNWWMSAVLYASYNLAYALVFFRSLGASSCSVCEAKLGGALGAAMLMIAMLAMNGALIAESEAISGFAIPTLYLAESISHIFGSLFSIVLLIEIFSTAAPMTWSVCSRFAQDGSCRAWVIGSIFILLAFCGSLLPFEKLVGTIYPLTGWAGLVFLACLVIKRVLRYNK